MTSLVVFDLDGTLFDCRRRQVDLTIWLLKKRGAKTLDIEKFWLLKRSGASTEKALINIYNDIELAQSVSREWKTLVELPDWLALDQPLPGVISALEQLRLNDIPMALLTARTNEQGLRTTLRRFELDIFFRDIQIVDPANAIMQKANILKTWGPAFFVGDTESDLQAATISDTQFLALTWGQRDVIWLESHGAKTCFSNLKSAVEFILTRSKTRIIDSGIQK